MTDQTAPATLRLCLCALCELRATLAGLVAADRVDRRSICEASNATDRLIEALYPLVEQLDADLNQR